MMTYMHVQLTISGVPGRKPSSPSRYITELLKRTEAARRMSAIERKEVAARLSEKTGHRVTLETYKKWESRTPIPHYFLIPFCEIVGSDPYFILTGKPFQLGRNPHPEWVSSLQTTPSLRPK